MSDPAPPTAKKTWSLPILKDYGYLPEEVTDSAWIDWLIFHELPLDVDVETIDAKYNYFGPCGWARMIKEQILRDNTQDEFKKTMTKATQVLFDEIKKTMTKELKDMGNGSGNYGKEDPRTSTDGHSTARTVPASTREPRKPDSRDYPSTSHDMKKASARNPKMNQNEDLRSGDHSAMKLPQTHAGHKRKADEQTKYKIDTGGSSKKQYQLRH